MKHITTLLLITGTLTGVPLAKGQSVIGSVLYQLTAPIDIYSVSGQPQTAVSNQVVGIGLEGSAPHALLFTASGGVDLNPTRLRGFTSSYAYGTNGAQQVGNGYGDATGAGYHALLWNSTADSAVDLHPINLSGFGDSIAISTDGTHQVGSGTSGGVNHALLWTGTADSAVDLNPTDLSGIDSSIAYGTSGNQQVGYGNGAGTGDHALLWTGTADSAVDLNPTGTTNSYAYGTNGTMEVGQGDGTAMLWTGTADSAVNLQNLLPVSGTWSDSTAYSIDDAGNIFGIADGTFNDVSGTFAVEWSVVPEPMAGSMMLCVGAAALMRRQRRWNSQRFDRDT